MAPLALIWIAFIIFVNVAAKKKKENAKSANTRQAAPRKQPQIWDEVLRSREASANPVSNTVAQERYYGEGCYEAGSLDYSSSEGESAWKHDHTPVITPHSDDHVVRPTSEGHHTHTESSIPSDSPCVPDAHNKSNEAPHARPAFVFDKSDVKRAVIYSEILGRPRALSRR